MARPMKRSRVAASSAVSGGRFGHRLRRFIHISMGATPFLYYSSWGVAIAHSLGLPTRHALLWLMASLVIVWETIRIWRGWVPLGHRAHEASHISSFAWGALSIILVFLLAPRGLAYAAPIILSCALADPLLGELRSRGISRSLVAIVGVLVVAAVWLAASVVWSISWKWALVLAPGTILVEWPNWRWIDDNALMMLVPLMIVCLQ